MTLKNSFTDKNLELLHLFLGKLFYAVAMADKKITPEEIAALKVTVLHNWHLINTEESNLNAQFNILSVFNNLQQIQADSATCYQEFRVFFEEHQKLFNEDLRKLIWHTANTIASSYAKKNKSEVIILAKLKMLFES